MLHWEDPASNRAMFAEKLHDLRETTDLVVLPEMFTTGFSMRGHGVAEPMEGPTVKWMRDQARALDAAIYGSAVITEGGACYNRGLFVKPDGTVTTYDKRHLFAMAGEHEHYAAGKKRVIAEWRGCRILLQVCYDLRFPVFARNRGDYDLALYVANWPEARRAHWDKLLMARAIENQAFTVGVNRVGMDGKGVHYTGGTTAVGPLGDAQPGDVPVEDGKESVTTVYLDRDALEIIRRKFPFAQDADRFELKV